MLLLKKVGVTGSPGSGKTSLCRFLEELGAKYISGDEIVHSLLANNPDIIEKVCSVVGEGVYKQGKIDRKEVAKRVFNDHALLEQLEDVLHPEVRKVLVSYLERLSLTQERKIVIAEIPLLFEANFQDLFDVTIFVKCEEESAKKRMVSGGNVDEKEYEKRKSRLLSDDEKEALADIVVMNNRDDQHLKREAIKLFKSLTKL